MQDIDDDEGSILARYKEEIQYYDKEASAWDERGRKILRRYKDERSPREARVPRYNILYSNTQTLLPAIYGKNPKADIERRFRDKDPLGRVTSDILERCTDYFVNTEAFRSSLRSALLDRLLPGRGSVWSRYVPQFKPMEELEDIESDDDAEPLEEVANESVATDYTSWQDIGHNWARVYDEIYLQWRKVYLTKKELIKRFGEEIAALIPLDYSPKGINDQKKETVLKKAVIYECWDKSEEMVRWLHKDVMQFLDEKPDPLKLPDFFPCPKHLYAVLANDSMIPVPDYIEYQDQANELDELTSRIGSITKSLKVAGVFDASAQGVERLLAEGVENKLIPVDQWAALSEKGGMKGVISLLPMEEIANTLRTLYETRDKVKSDLYEITGMADIVRGANDPNESATATNTKNKFITMRLSDSQDDMARFARDCVKNVACIIAQHFSIETIKKISGVRLLTDQEKQQFQMQQQQLQQTFQQQTQQHQQIAQQMQGMQQQGQPQQQIPPAPTSPPPVNDDMQELLDNPTWEQVEQLLKDEPSLSFKIDIEIDSTIKQDEQEDQRATVEFVKMAGEFMAQMKEAPPQAQPLLVHMLMFGARKFNVGKGIEAQLQIFSDQVEKQAQKMQGQPPPPSPEMIKAQAQIQVDQAEQAAQEKQMQSQQQMDMAESDRQHQYKMQEMQQDAALKEKQMNMDFDFKMREATMKLQADSINSDKQRQHEQTMTVGEPNQREDEVKRVLEAIQQQSANAQAMHNDHQKALMGIAQGIQGIHQASSKPKTVSMTTHDGRTLQATVQ